MIKGLIFGKKNAVLREVDDLRYAFVWKDKNGRTHRKSVRKDCDLLKELKREVFKPKRT